MGFLDELKKLTRPYDEDEDDYIDDAEVVNPPEADRPRPNPFAGFGGTDGAQSASAAQRPAPRPRNSALRKSVLNLLGYRTPDWKTALEEFVRDEFPVAQAQNVL